MPLTSRIRHHPLQRQELLPYPGSKVHYLNANATQYNKYTD